MPTTPRGIVYPNSSDHTRLWEHLQETAETADAAVDTARKFVRAATAINPPVAVNADVEARIQTWAETVTLSGAGLYATSYPVPFASRVLYVSGFTINGSGINPVINASQVSLTGMSLIWPGAGAISVTFCAMAIGF